MTNGDETATADEQTRDNEHPHERRRMSSNRHTAELVAALQRYSDEERE